MGVQIGIMPVLQTGHDSPPLLELEVELALELELEDAAPPAPPVFPPPAPDALDEVLLLEAFDELDETSPELLEPDEGDGLVPSSSRQEEATREVPQAMIANNRKVFAGKGFTLIHLE